MRGTGPAYDGYRRTEVEKHLVRHSCADNMRTVLDSLRLHASVAPADVCYTYLDSLLKGADLTYGELLASAQNIASNLLRRGSVGDRVLLLLPSGTAFLRAFWG